jgi:sterol desaturase/sphingolipid hydroxylase (fatty acid hydroxylase superfamily)
MMTDWVFRAIDQAQGAIFENAVEPVLYQLGLMDWAEDVFDGVGVALFGVIAVAVTYLLLRPLEWWRPVERWTERRAVWTDIVYTLVHKLGVVPALFFVVLTPIGAMIDGYLRFQGYIPPTLEQLMPALRDWPFATFLVYIVLLDFGEYWRHRLQHRLPWWWALHSLHHDQQQMTLWSDDRNHLLDDVLTVMWAGTIGLLIGVAPEEFPFVVIVFRMIESLSHTNVRLGFGRIGGVLLVGPQYHRVHHSIEHARPPFDRSRGCNFAVILPIWDVVFGTWRPAPYDLSLAFPATGVAKLDGSRVRCGYLAHQVEGLRRLGAELRRLVNRRRPGFVAAFPRGGGGGDRRAGAA